MNGITLSEAFFHDCVTPLLARRFAGKFHTVSAAILGSGSEILGLDDEISRDHNYTPRVIVFLADEAYDRLAPGLLDNLRYALPASYRGFALLWSNARQAADIVPLH